MPEQEANSYLYEFNEETNKLKLVATATFGDITIKEINNV